MRVPLIKIKSKDGCEHIIGENPHDLLYIDENGAMQYLNIKTHEGTKGQEAEYIFTGTSAGKDEYSVTGRPEVDFATIEKLIEIEEEHLKEQITRCARLNGIVDQKTKEMDPKAYVTADDHPIDPIVCPISKNEFCSLSPDLFQTFVNQVIDKIIAANQKGNLRMLDRKTGGTTCDFTQRVFRIRCWNDCLDDPLNPDIDHIYAFEDDYPLLTKIITKKDDKLISSMAHEKADRVLLAREIGELMRRHYYDNNELDRLTKMFDEQDKAIMIEMAKKWEKEKEEHLANLNTEGEMLRQKYGIQFEYAYATGVRIVHGEEKIDYRHSYNGYPAQQYIARLVCDEEYHRRKAEYDRIASLINNAEGKNVNPSCFVKRKELDDFIKDSPKTRDANPKKKYVAYIDENDGGRKKKIFHWKLVDIACCNERLFASVLDAMRDYVTRKGLNIDMT